ncbi:GDSL-like Lipase/Acylhydrolase superfamily protein [Perilla frutescens var. hirtella]|nr:GDSL-like Lipase/Acylhydrolase superfamily protein [Perilla frutescens var. frutescens]KAH6792968.1 GDSL-like Lipase/Acylhydrolase superfamily protein [Perilla frutescens var. hirtella]
MFPYYNYSTFRPLSSVLFLVHFQLLLLVFALHVAESRNLAEKKTSISAIFVFGDSTVDSGNNNFIQTISKSNFPPYGRDFPNHTPTGRFTNGKLVTDFLASYVGVKDSVPPYLDPSLSIQELITGVSFASAGSGFDPLTPTISNVIPLSGQLNYLKEYKGKVEAAIGKEKAKEVIRNALFLVSAGTNDFVINYFTIPIRRQSYTIQSYIDFVVKGVRQFLQGLFDQGARRIGVVGLPPMGCLPIVITLFADNPFLKRDCIANFSSIARDFNQILQTELNAMQLQVEEAASGGARIAYLDAYSPLEEMTSGHKYGFDVVSSGCCGTGMVEAAFMCNSNSRVCDDATKYVFWDSIHPTQKSYELLFQALRPAIDNLLGN